MEMKNMHGGPCLESSKREFDNLADFLGMDDLLDFSNDDIAGPILGPSLISPADICIPPPCEEIAELEWLSNFVEDDESFYYGANFSGNGESKPTAAEGYNTSSSISITTTNNTAPSPSPSPSSSTSTSSSASLGNMAMAMAMAMTMTMGGSNSNSNNTSSSTSSSSNSSNSCDGSLQVQTGTPVPGRARSKRPRKEGAASGWVSSHSRLTLSHPEPSSLSPESSYYKGYYEDSSNITFLDCSSTSTMAAESTPFLIHFKPSPANPSTISHQPSTYNTPTPPPLPKKVTIKQSSWHAKTAPPSSTNSSSTTTTTTTTTSTTTTGETGQEAGGQCRKCLHCGSQKTPQWRAGPLGPKTLCNACGVRHKSGRLFPEYRPVASPTFVASVHSNSHRKVMEIRGLKQRTYYHHQHHHQQQQHHVAITTVTTTGTTSCSPPSYSFPSFN